MSVLTTLPTDNGRNCASDNERRHNAWNKQNWALAPSANSVQADHLRPPARLMAMVAILACSATLHADELAASSNLRSELQRTVSVQFGESPLRDCFLRLGKTQSIPVFVDRRVDPTLKVNVSASQESIESIVRRITGQHSIGMGYVGPVLYVGPPLTAARISTLTVQKNGQASALSPPLRKKMLARSRLAWSRLSEPRFILQKLCAEVGLQLERPELIPHDLWIEADYPPMTMPERLTLVLSGFGMTYGVDEKRKLLKLQSIPRSVNIERTYRTRVDVSRIIPALSKDYPGAFIRGDGNELSIRATMEDHWAVDAYLNPDKRPKPKGEGEQVYSLNVKDQPLAPLLEKIASQLGIKVEYGTGARTLADQRVSFRVTNVTMEELFQAAAGPANLSASVNESTKSVRIE